jgi:hypothetical protein
MLGKLKDSNDRIRNRNRELPAYSTVSQPSTLPRAAHLENKNSTLNVSHASVHIKQGTAALVVSIALSEVDPYSLSFHS